MVWRYYAPNESEGFGVARALRVGGTAKDLFEAEQTGALIQQFKDTQQNRRKPDETESRQNSSSSKVSLPRVSVAEQPRKGANGNIATLANDISSYLFQYLSGFRIPTHFMDKVSGSEMLVKQLAMIPMFVRVHNVAAGEFAKKFGMKEATELTIPIIEHYYKNPELGNPMTNEFHLYSLGIVTPDQLRTINRIASKTNVVLRSFFERRELKLLSIDLEFGLSGEQVMIGDEISPRTCRFADLQKKDRGRDVFALAGNDSIEAYTEVRNRIYRSF